MLPRPLNKKQINALVEGSPTTYVIQDTDDIINVDTTVGPVDLYLPNIQGSGLYGNPRSILINDVGLNASLNPITLRVTGNDTISNESSLILDVDGINVQCVICDQNKWAINDLGLKSNIETPIVIDFPAANAITFEQDAIYGTTDDPMTGDITSSEDIVSRSKAGVTNLIVHEDSIEPDFPNQWRLVNGAYTVDVLNYIYVQYIGNSVYLYSILQEL